MSAIDPAAAIASIESGPQPDPDVELVIGDAGPRGRRATRRTILTILSLDPRWAGRIVLDSFQNVVNLDGRPITGPDLTRISCWIEAVYEAAPTKDLVHEVAACFADDRAVHPVRTWLEGLSWDGVERASSLLPSYLGVKDGPLTREMGKAFLIGAVARILRPGCKVDTMLVLVGRQGAGKSRFCGALVPYSSWFGDTPIDLRSKDAYIALQGKWIIELAELEALRGRAATRVKAFLSSPVDTYRAPYDRTAQDHPRQCVFVGTSNHPELFDDGTGSRRFWPVQVGHIDVAAVARDRDQLWAEAVACFRRGDAWHLDPNLEVERQTDADAYQVTDPLRERLEAWLRDRRDSFTTSEAIIGLGIALDRVDRSTETRLGPLLRNLGCIKFRVRQNATREWRWELPRMTKKQVGEVGPGWASPGTESAPE